MKEDILKYKIEEIKNQFKDINNYPQTHDGCYEFVHNIIEQYQKELSNADNWGLTDLDLLYYATTFEADKIKIDRIKESNIKDKSVLYEKLQKLEEKTYSNNIDNIYEKPIGLFKRVYGGYSKNPSPYIKNDFAQKFIMLCIELILDKSNNTKIYESIKNHEIFNIMGAEKTSCGIISQILHCIKPETFPTLNGGAIKFYKNELNIEQVSNKLNGYILSCKAIENFKNQNHLDFNNYRILDLIALGAISKTDIDYRIIYDFLEKYAGEKYSKTQTSIAEAGKKAKNEVEKFCNYIDNKFDKKLKLSSRIQWQGDKLGQSTIVECFWLQFKNPEFKNEPHSISLVFYVNENKELGLDIKTETKNNADIEKFNKSAVTPPPNGFRLDKSDDYGKIHTIKTKIIDINNTDKDYFDKVISETEKDIELLLPNYEKIFNGDDNMDKLPLNLILYGPPGTGKTYNTVVKAMEIIGLPENKPNYITIPDKEEPKEDKFNYNDLVQKINKAKKEKQEYSNQEYRALKQAFNNCKKQGRIEFITFHQSYSYEEFVEGIKPVILDKENWGNPSEKIQYTGKDGIFKEICKRAFDEAYKDFKEYIQDNELILETSKDKAKFKVENQKELDGIVVIPRSGNNTPINIKKSEIKNPENMKNRYGYAESILEHIRKHYAKPYILIIDEINRGNISKIFGELITLIEEDKRLGADNEMTVTLPYSQQSDFGVPNNLYIIGTMNTADKSIAQIDTALRRRFVFEEMPPRPELLGTVENYNLEKFLTNINEKIEQKLDKHHKIGHAYLMNLKDKDDLERAFLNKIYPLLQEYFYDDESDIAEIFGYEKDEFKKLTKNNDWWEKVIEKNSKDNSAKDDEEE